MKPEVIRQWSDKYNHWRLIKRGGVPAVQYKSRSTLYRTKYVDHCTGDAALYWLAAEICNLRARLEVPNG